MDKPRTFKPIRQGGLWEKVTFNPDGTVIVTATEEYGGGSVPMLRPERVSHFEALVASGKWEEV